MQRERRATLLLRKPAVSPKAVIFVEEMVVSNFWPLGKHRPRMTLVRMKLPVFGSAEREFCPYFYLSHVEDETDE